MAGAFVQLNITFGEVGGFAPGAVIDHLTCSITGSVTPVRTQSVPPTQNWAQFPSTPPDTYNYSVQACAADNTPLGAPATGTFTVNTLAIPTTVEVGIT